MLAAVASYTRFPLLIRDQRRGYPLLVRGRRAIGRVRRVLSLLIRDQRRGYPLLVRDPPKS